MPPGPVALREPQQQPAAVAGMGCAGLEPCRGPVQGDAEPDQRHGQGQGDDVELVEAEVLDVALRRTGSWVTGEGTSRSDAWIAGNSVSIEWYPPYNLRTAWSRRVDDRVSAGASRQTGRQRNLRRGRRTEGAVMVKPTLKTSDQDRNLSVECGHRMS